MMSSAQNAPNLGSVNAFWSIQRYGSWVSERDLKHVEKWTIDIQTYFAFWYVSYQKGWQHHHVLLLVLGVCKGFSLLKSALELINHAYDIERQII